MGGLNSLPQTPQSHHVCLNGSLLPWCPHPQPNSRGNHLCILCTVGISGLQPSVSVLNPSSHALFQFEHFCIFGRTGWASRLGVINCKLNWQIVLWLQFYYFCILCIFSQQHFDPTLKIYSCPSDPYHDVSQVTTFSIWFNGQHRLVTCPDLTPIPHMTFCTKNIRKIQETMMSPVVTLCCDIKKRLVLLFSC